MQFLHIKTGNTMLTRILVVQGGHVDSMVPKHDRAVVAGVDSAPFWVCPHQLPLSACQHLYGRCRVAPKELMDDLYVSKIDNKFEHLNQLSETKLEVLELSSDAKTHCAVHCMLKLYTCSTHTSQPSGFFAGIY